MKYLQFLAAVLAVAPSVFSAPSTRAADDNPFSEYTPYATKDYAKKLEETIETFLDAGDTLNADRARTVQKAPTFVWITQSAAVAKIRPLVAEALEAQEATGKKRLVQLVIYNLPDRDCASRVSAGEFDLENDGLNKYKAFIDAIVAELSTTEADKLQFAVVLEPDALGNLITNLHELKCKGAESAYKEGTSYAVAKLQRENVAIYLDAAHGGWLGWSANLSPSAKLFASVVEGAQVIAPGAKVRGLSINVANYNKYIGEAPEVPLGNDSWDEYRFVDNLSRHLASAGFPAHFIVDQGRSGVAGVRSMWGFSRCNIRGAGLGHLPTTDQAVIKNNKVDAIVWVKPPGESDGTSDEASPNFDPSCASDESHVPAPEAGEWFNEYAVNLIKNANPPIEA